MYRYLFILGLGGDGVWVFFVWRVMEKSFPSTLPSPNTHSGSPSRDTQERIIQCYVFLPIQVSELSNALSEDRATANHASQVLEEESMERMRLERSFHELQVMLYDII